MVPGYLPEHELHVDVLADTIRKGSVFHHIVWMGCAKPWGFTGPEAYRYDSYRDRDLRRSSVDRTE